jgi:hypothetical protein
LSPSLRPHERWIWTELIGFDVTQPDHGVQEYLDDAGFVPDAICLLLTSPDFVLSHEDREDEFELWPDYCSRDGHELGRHRQRQVWTNRQLQRLIAGLQARGIQVYLTVFTQFYHHQFHHEWLGDHPEVCSVYAGLGRVDVLNVNHRLADGSFVEDYFAAKLVRAMQYYGFDGWHGADGYGPLSGTLWQASVGDDMADQFVTATGVAVPEELRLTGDTDIPKLQERIGWIWRHHRAEWIGFWADRWARFWGKTLGALHAAGKKGVINSAWGRAPFESLYRYGIDYRKIVDAGVDGIIVETVAAGLHLNGPFQNESCHYDFLSMLLLIRAYVPEAKLIFLHNVHDICEEWDALRHIPCVLEREVFSLANVWLYKPLCGAGVSPADSRAGETPAPRTAGLRPAADGFLSCLGDGLLPREWEWLRERWELAFGTNPTDLLGATLVWSDAVMHAQVGEFTARRTWFVHRLLFHLMAHGAPVQAAVRVEDLDAVSGSLLVLRGDLMPEAERQALAAYDRGPVVAIGVVAGDCPDASLQFRDLNAPGELTCHVYGWAGGFDPALGEAAPEIIPPDMLGVEDQSYYWYHMYARAVSAGFLQSCADVVAQVSGAPRLATDTDTATIMAMTMPDGKLRLALKSKRHYYVKPEVEVGHPIRDVQVVSEFPLVRVRPQGSRFSVRIPPHGLVVLDLQLDG